MTGCWYSREFIAASDRREQRGDTLSSLLSLIHPKAHDLWAELAAGLPGKRAQ